LFSPQSFISDSLDFVERFKFSIFEIGVVIFSSEEEDEHEELIKRTREVLQRHRGEASPGFWAEVFGFFACQKKKRKHKLSKSKTYLFLF